MKRSLFFRILGSIFVVGAMAVATHCLNLLVWQELFPGESCQGILPRGWLWNLFYIQDSTTGYHVEPSTFSLYFSLFMGVLVGGILSYFLFFKKYFSHSATRF